MDYAAMICEIDTLIRAQDWFDFGVAEYSDGAPLILRGSLDETWGYNLEITFHGVAYIEVPTSWTTPKSDTPVFKCIDQTELASDRLERLLSRGGRYVFAILAEFPHSEQWLCIAADGVSYRHNAGTHWPWIDASGLT